MNQLKRYRSYHGIVRLWVLQAAVCFGVAARAAQIPEPAISRLDEKPAWEKDLTEGLRRVMPDGSEVAYTEAMSRRAQVERPGPTGDLWTWRSRVEAPAGVPVWPMVLEFDESRVVASIELDGKSMPLPDRSLKGAQHVDGEGFLMLPFDGRRRQGELQLKVLPMRQVYDNGFGRIRLRPATLTECLTFDALEGGGVKVTNRSAVGLGLALHARNEDYFGAPLSAADEATVSLPAGATHFFNVNLPASPWLYRTRVWAAGGHFKLQIGLPAESTANLKW